MMVVVTGGQTGVDEGALQAAEALAVPWRAIFPRGFRREAPAPDWMPPPRTHEWLRATQPRLLAVGGPRESKWPGAREYALGFCRALIPLALAGCLGTNGANAAPLAVEPVTMPGVSDSWAGELDAAVARWDALLACDAPSVAAGGLPVRGWPAADWPHPTHHLGVYGVSGIDVIADLPAPRLQLILMHEIGHAMGLGHSDRGVMAPDVREPEPDDGAEACP